LRRRAGLRRRGAAGGGGRARGERAGRDRGRRARQLGAPARRREHRAGRQHAGAGRGGAPERSAGPLGAGPPAVHHGRALGQTCARAARRGARAPAPASLFACQQRSSGCSRCGWALLLHQVCVARAALRQPGARLARAPRAAACPPRPAAPSRPGARAEGGGAAGGRELAPPAAHAAVALCGHGAAEHRRGGHAAAATAGRLREGPCARARPGAGAPCAAGVGEEWVRAAWVASSGLAVHARARFWQPAGAPCARDR
jgi:hypothetical protein